jgi:hypothetical protein
MNRPPSRGRPWTASDRTAGPLDELLDQLRSRIPGLVVERLAVTHPADDDNVYFIGDEHQRDQIQLDTAPDGQPSFCIENGGRHQTSQVREAASIIASYLQQSGPPRSTT